MIELSACKLVDLTHDIHNNIPTWDTNCGFSLSIMQDHEPESAFSFKVQHYNTPAGIGTHIDAPAHCFKGAPTVDALPLNTLFNPCVMIDVSGDADEDFLLSEQHLKTWEKQHGRIKKNSLAIIHTGWGRLWPKPAYRNNLRFPAIGLDAARFLLTRDIRGLGIDTLSVDRPKSSFVVHREILGAHRFIIENVAHADLLPETGSYALSLPLKIKGGTEAPMRLVAFVP